MTQSENDGFPIPIQAFKDAYEKTGLTPMAGDWWAFRLYGEDLTEHHCACPISVLVASRKGWAGLRKTGLAGMVAALAECGYTLTCTQLINFTEGVDSQADDPSTGDEDARRAFRFGQRVRREVVEPLLVAKFGDDARVLETFTHSRNP